MYNLTQTTLGRVCPTTTSASCETYVDTLVLQVIASLVRQHTRQLSEHRTLRCRVSLEGAGQRACTVPTSATNTVICFALLIYSITLIGKGKPSHPCPK